MGCAPTASTSSVMRGSSRVSTQGACSNIDGSAASMPEVSLPHIGWPPTRSMLSAAAHSTTSALVLAMSVTGLPSASAPSFAKSSRIALIGAPTTTTSAISTTLRSVLAVETTSRSSALRTTMGLRSLPTTTMSGRAFFSARAKDDPMRPRPTTATVGNLGELLLHCAEQPSHVGHQVVERLEVERLRTVRQRLVGRRVHLDDEAVRARGDRRQRHGADQRPPAGGLRRIDDHRQVRELSHQGHGVEVERETRRGLEGPDAALAQDHVAVALRQDVLSRQQPLLDGRGHAALQQHRLARLSRLLEQRVVLHVASPQLEDVR